MWCLKPLRRLTLTAAMIVSAAGAATVELPDGSRYDGELGDNRLHGQGVLVWANGDRYEGGFKNGLMHGEGQFAYASGDQYVGEMRKGLSEGEGVLEYADGSRYQGQFVSGYPSGQGTLTFVSGESYRGSFAYGHYSGQGLLSYRDGGEYEGAFAQGREHGEGEMRTPDGAVYRGTFEDQGFVAGRWTLPNGDYYEGTYTNWIITGKGSYVSEAGTYSGNFENGYLMYGTHERSDGGTYEGGFDGYYAYHGIGRLTAADGTVSEGQFSYGDYDGPAPSWLDSLAKTAVALVDDMTPGHSMTGPDPAELLAEKSLYVQEALLTEALEAVPSERPGEIDLYIVQVAGDGRQEVFRREVEFASAFYGGEWQAADRLVTLANSRISVERLPMATRSSLRRTLEAVAGKMDRDQDILLLYLTSHGSSDHELSLAQRGMRLPDLPAAELGEMLREVDIEHKVVIVAACYSGGFIPHLDDGKTLVMTSARADRNSFGCADQNEMTDFGRAFLAESLSESESLVEAFGLAREKVAEWEEEQDLTPSEPQLLRAEAVEAQLAAWRAKRQQITGTAPQSE
ncbi:MAG: C13 family peptidase [Pseudomonadota bacterium]